jgi:hypothetical protein
LKQKIGSELTESMQSDKYFKFSQHNFFKFFFETNLGSELAGWVLFMQKTGDQKPLQIQG